MLKSDQPAIFGKNIVAAVSSVSDGNMRFGRGDDKQTLENRLAFFEKAGIDPKNATLVQVTYENAEHFARYRIVVDELRGEGIFKPESNTVADALVTTEPNHALFLPLADCTGIILYDEKQRILMMSHVGRHSAEIDGAKTSVAFLEEKFATDPKHLKVWLSPAVGKATYPITAKGNQSLREVILEQLDEAGVPVENIEASAVDTAQSENYFSHSQFKLGNRNSDGRFAIVAQMRGQGEPAS